MANEAADFVLSNPAVFDELFEGLTVPDDVVRGRTADALEKIARTWPDPFRARIPKLIQIAKRDDVAMVKMHIAMLFGHLAIYEDKIDKLYDALLELLQAESVFARSWAIVSLCIIARKYPEKSDSIVNRLVQFKNDESAAIRSRVKHALHLLTNRSASFPKGWIKSEHLQEL
jgi:hypothetical protein